MYEPFGEPKAAGKLLLNRHKEELLHVPFGFTGEAHDFYSGLIYLRARYYDPGVGSFISRDSYLGDLMRPLSQNRYTYVENNPINYIDPDGHFVLPTQWAGAIIGGLVGLGSTVVRDVFTGDDQTWEDYIGNTIGGAAGGYVVGSGTVIIASATNAIVSETVTNTLKRLTPGEEEINTFDESVANVFKNTIIGTAAGYIATPLIGAVPALSKVTSEAAEQVLEGVISTIIEIVVEESSDIQPGSQNGEYSWSEMGIGQDLKVYRKKQSKRDYVMN